MKSFLNRGLGLVTLGALLALACAHDDSSVFIGGVLAPPSVSSTTAVACAYKADPAQARLFSGTVDAEFLASYRPVVLVGNQLIAKGGGTENQRTETARVSLQGATVTVEDADGKQRASFTTLSSGFVDPASGATPAYGALQVTLINPTLMEELYKELQVGETKRLLARFKVFGQTLGGQAVESNEAQFPINACRGCLVNFPPAAAPDCAGTTEGDQIAIPCVKGQDELIDCRLCRSLDVCNPAKRR